MKEFLAYFECKKAPVGKQRSKPTGSAYQYPLIRISGLLSHEASDSPESPSLTEPASA
jgi:hypothetical protein